ncbi:MAG: AlbA family DNA-binding domain-containing protein [Nocardioidaceae bacterium]
MDPAPRLEAVFSARLAGITWDHLGSIVSRQTAEDLSIDFKQNHYILNRAIGRTVLPSTTLQVIDERIAKDRFELAKDTTAFANAAGGLIVVGVADANGRAQRITPVELRDRQRLAYLDVIRIWTARYLSGIGIGHLSSSSDSDQGCVLSYVPASADGPHAVVEPNSHRHAWYVRDGGHATPLSEAQIAVAYRDRFAGRADLEQRVRAVFDQGVGELDRQGRVCLAAAIVPSRGATRRLLDRRLLDEFRAQTQVRQQQLPGALLGHCTSFGRGRVVLRETPSGTHAGDHLMHLYADGSAFAGVVLDTLSDAGAIAAICHRRREPLRTTVQCIRVGSLTTWV